MASAEILHYFVELDNFFATADYNLRDVNHLEHLSRHLEDHISIIAMFLMGMSNCLQPNNAERNLHIFLEQIYECLSDILDQITEEDVRQMDDTHSSSQRARPR